MMFFPVIIFTITLIVIVSAIDYDEVPRTEIQNGKLRGLHMQTISGKLIEAYLGIPYASPPVGKLRFKPPVDPVSWTEERNATSDPPSCVQFSSDPDSGKPVLAGQEDCLYVNVFKPKDPEYTSPLPVMVYIHGGGLFMCSSTIKDYGPEYFLEKDIILVTFNYRLEILGFLSTEDKEATGNNGFKDQVAVLKWVRNNIEYFGGDPEQVTLYGHSAGGYSVHYHVLSPFTKGLFGRAISGSGTMYALYPNAKGVIAQRTKLVGEYCKCPTFDSSLLISCLQRTSVEELFSHLYKFKVWGNDPHLIFGPVIESESEISDDNLPFITLNSLMYANISIPWIVGFNSEDGLLATAGLSMNSALLDQLENKFQKLAPMIFRYDYHYDKNMITTLLKQFYFGKDRISRETIPQLTNVYTDAVMFGILKSLTLHKGPVYLYYFSHRGKYSGTDDVTKPQTPQIKDKIDSYIRNGVAHGDELQLIFPMMKSLKYKKELQLTKSDETVSRKLIQLITDFVILRDLEQFNWKPTSFENLEYMHMSSTSFSMKKNLLSNRSQFWSHWTTPLEDQKQFKEEL